MRSGLDLGVQYSLAARHVLFVAAVSAACSASRLVDRELLRFVVGFLETADRTGPSGAQVFSFFFRRLGEVGVGMFFSWSPLPLSWLDAACSVAIVIRCCSIHRSSFSYRCTFDSASSTLHCRSSTLAFVSSERPVSNPSRAAFNASL